MNNLWKTVGLAGLGVIAFAIGLRTQDFKVYQNYDFMTGDKIVFEDDFRNTQDGEFPALWDLLSGQGVVNLMNGEPVFALTEGNYVKVAPRVKSDVYLEDPFTVEFDFFSKAGGGEGVQVFFKTDVDDEKFIFFGTEVRTGYSQNDLSATTPGGPEGFLDKWHHGALVYAKDQIKGYIDQSRVLVVPHAGFKPQAVRFGGIADPEHPILLRNVRIANGGGMNLLDKLMKGGRIVTHGILFDVNKAVLKPQSMGTLNGVAKLLTQNPGLKLEVGGHTDSDGDAAANQKLSEARAAAVKKTLVDIGIDGSRLTTKGYGASKPIDSNATPEGKANNRRVEFVKL
jgi:OmpA-OmpF porin, OOP family